MIIAAIFLPAFICLMIRYKQDKYSEKSKMVIEYGIYTLIITLLVQIIITYVFGIQDVIQEALESFSFFIKYTITALILAIIIPFFQAALEKYFEISVEVGVYDEEEGHKEKAHSKSDK